MEFLYSGKKVNYIVQGDGAPVLMLHGWGGKIDSFLPLIRDLSPKYRVIALDFPGHAKSEEPDGVWWVKDFAACVTALLDELKIERVSIVAHSFGGRVALWIASHEPERVDRMVLTGCAGLRKDPAEASLRQKLVKSAQKLPGLREGGFLHEAAVSLFGSADYRALTPSMRKTFSAVVEEDLSFCLDKIECPVILIWGTRDTATPIGMGEIMEKKIKDAALIRLEGGTHFAYLEQYPRFKAITEAFLEG